MSGIGKVGVTIGLFAVVALASEQKSAGDTGGGGGSSSGGGSVADIPADYLDQYRAAGNTCPALDWALLAGIGKVETDHGRAELPGVRSGANSAGARGPMQFLDDTFREVHSKHPVGSDVFDPADAIPAAAHYLCDSGLADGDEYRAIYQYNHADWYVTKVRNQAQAYRDAA